MPAPTVPETKTIPPPKPAGEKTDGTMVAGLAVLCLLITGVIGLSMAVVSVIQEAHVAGSFFLAVAAGAFGFLVQFMFRRN
jgi:putative exporter of polyketide antibiotics